MAAFDKNVEYGLVRGWFEQSGGLDAGRFYGACFRPERPFEPVRVVLKGEDAQLASQAAQASRLKVDYSELHEELEQQGQVACEMVSTGAIAMAPGGVVSMQPQQTLLTQNQAPKRRRRKSSKRAMPKPGMRLPTINQAPTRTGGPTNNSGV